jgi:hypothetical protein
LKVTRGQCYDNFLAISANFRRKRHGSHLSQNRQFFKQKFYKIMIIVPESLMQETGWGMYVCIHFSDKVHVNDLIKYKHIFRYDLREFYESVESI